MRTTENVWVCGVWLGDWLCESHIIHLFACEYLIKFPERLTYRMCFGVFDWVLEYNSMFQCVWLGDYYTWLLAGPLLCENIPGMYMFACECCEYISILDCENQFHLFVFDCASCQLSTSIWLFELTLRVYSCMFKVYQCVIKFGLVCLTVDLFTIVMCVWLWNYSTHSQQFSHVCWKCMTVL